jgi:hypothetical protein
VLLQETSGGGPVVRSIGANFAAASLPNSNDWFIKPTVLVRYRRSGDLTDDSLSVFPLDRPQSEEAIATRIKKRQSLTGFPSSCQIRRSKPLFYGGTSRLEIRQNIRRQGRHRPLCVW